MRSTDIAPDGLAVRGSRRNGIDRLLLFGDLDRRTFGELQRQIDPVVHAGGALVVDLRELTSIDAAGTVVLQGIANRAQRDGWRLCIVNCPGALREEFELTGTERLLSARDVTDLLDGGEGEWSRTPLSPLPGQNVQPRRRVTAERS